MKKNLLKGTAGLLAGIMIMSQVPVSAKDILEDYTPAAAISSPAMTRDIAIGGGHFNFEGLVEAGLITAEQAEEMKVFMDAQKIEIDSEFKISKILDESTNQEMTNIKMKVERKDIFEEFVTAGIITEEESSKIIAYQATQAKIELEKVLDEKFARYTAESILTEKEAEDAKEYLSNLENIDLGGVFFASEVSIADFDALGFEEFNSEAIAAFESIESVMTLEASSDMMVLDDFEGEDVFAGGDSAFHMTTMSSSFMVHKLVEAEIVSAEQLEAMNESDMNYFQAQRDLENEAVLDQLISDGSITETEKTSILEHLKSKTNFVAHITVIDGEIETKEIDESTGKAVPFFDALVTNGSISQETADLVSKALFTRP